MWSGHHSPFADPGADGFTDTREACPQLLGSGREALTLWAFTSCLRTFLLQLQDRTAPEDVTVLFRPGFGRARTAGPRSVGAELGRFDAIVRTGQALYLVDTRWHRSESLADESLFVSNTQRRKHRVFREYVEQWRSLGSPGWEDLEPRVTAAFKEKGLRARPAPAGSHLARNLEFTLRTCADPAVPVEDVILLAAPRGWSRMPAPPEGYRLVQLEYEPCEGSE